MADDARRHRRCRREVAGGLAWSRGRRGRSVTAGDPGRCAAPRGRRCRSAHRGADRPPRRAGLWPAQHDRGAPRADGLVVGAIVLSRRLPDRWSPARSRMLERTPRPRPRPRSVGRTRIARPRARASTDALTGLPNRRYFDEFCGLLAQRRRADDAVGVVMVDIDHFKALNDTYGHPVGDKVLQGRRRGARRDASATRTFRRATAARSSRVLLRKPAPGRRAARSGERIRAAVAALDLSALGPPRRHACRSGVATARSADQPIVGARGPGRRGALPRQASGTRSRESRETDRAHDARVIDEDARDLEPEDDDAGDGADPDGSAPPDERRRSRGSSTRSATCSRCKGELVFKTVAYHRAADAIGAHAVRRRGRVPRRRSAEDPGRGAAIDAKIAELATTGRMGFYERLREEVPPALVELLRVPGVGPRTVRLLYETLGIENLEDLRHAARGRSPAHRARPQRSGPRHRSWRGSRRSRRSRAGCCSAAHASIVDSHDRRNCASSTASTRLEAAGSFRRRRETIGDLDILAETSAPDALIGTVRRPRPGRARARIAAGTRRPSS